MLVVAALALWLAGCGQPPHKDYLTDIILHVLALRSAISRADPSYEAMLVDAQHIDQSARELRSSYPDDPGRALVMSVQLHAYELTTAIAARDRNGVAKALAAIETKAKELQAMR